MDIVVRFDLLYNLAHHDIVQLHRRTMSQVPSEGQIVNINGDPYRVVEVAWAVGDEDPNVYAYVEVQKASAFTVTLGGREY